MENVEFKQEIKNSDDGKGILITNDAIEQIANLLKGQSDKKALRVGVRSAVRPANPEPTIAIFTFS